MVNKFQKQYSSLLSEMLNQKQYRLNATYHWPFNCNDAVCVVTGTRGMEGTTSNEIIEIIKRSGEWMLI